VQTCSLCNVSSPDQASHCLHCQADLSEYSTTTQALDCVAGDECVDGEAADVGAPVFMHIDFEKKAVIGAKRTTPILLMTDQTEQVLLAHESERVQGSAGVVMRNHLTNEIVVFLVEEVGLE